MADNLESYFKKHLTDDTPASDKWNVPPDDVWDKVAPVIQKKKGLFIPWKYLYLIGILTGVALLFLLWPSNRTGNSNLTNDEALTSQSTGAQNKPVVDGSENTTASENQEQQRPAATSADPKANMNIDSGGELNQGKFLSDATPENEKMTIASVEREPGSPAATTNRKANAAKARSNEIADGMKNIESGAIAAFLPANESGQARIKTISKKTLTLISPANINTLLPASPLLASIVLADVAPNRKKPFENNGRFGIGAFFSPTLTSTFVTGEPAEGKIETGNMFLYSSNWGFELRYHISNRFTLFGGVGKSEIKSWSKSYVDFGYDLSTEHVMSISEKENTSPVAMSTPFGEIDTEITYRFAHDEDIPDGEPMQSVMETHQDVKYLSVPLGVEYNLIRFSHFNWFAETGLRYNRALKDATQFSSRILHNGNDMTVVEEEMTNQPVYTENYLNAFVGTGVNYQFSKAFQIGTSARYSRSITRVNFHDNLSTHVQEVSLNIGLVYIF